MDSLSRQVLEENERHKIALDQYIRNLQGELDAVNNLLVRLPVLLATGPAHILAGWCRELVRGELSGGSWGHLVSTC